MYSRRNYPLLLISQFFGAFGDNAVLAVIVGQLTYLQQSHAISESELRTASTIYTLLLFVPYVLLAPIAGFLNDRYSKSTWLASGNALKLLGAIICATTVGYGAFWQGLGYFVVGIGACFYGPAKYGSLPEILPREKLVRANGTVELLTLIAILTGQVGGAMLSDAFHDHPFTAHAIVVAIYAAGTVCNLAMTRTPNDPSVEFGPSFRAFGHHVAELFRAPRLGRILIGSALFWVCGATMKTNFQPWGLTVLHLTNNTEIALLGLWLSVGVMLGSVLAGRLHRVGDLRATRTYGAALAVLLVVMYAVAPSRFWLEPLVHLKSLAVPVPVAGVLVLAGLAAGLFLIPLNAALQSESDPGKLGKTIAVQNLCDNIGMLTAAGYVLIATKIGMSASAVFLGLAVGVGIAVVYFRFARPRSAATSSPAPAVVS